MRGWKNIIPLLLLLASSCNCQYVIKDIWGEPPNSTSGWTTSLGDNGYTSECNGQTIIGGYNKFGAGAWAEKIYSGLPAHNTISLEFDAYFIDSWDGEKYLVEVDSVNVYGHPHRYVNSSVNFCGASYPDYQTTVNLGPISHNSTSIILHFHSGLDQTANDESFGFKNIKITVHAFCATACVTCFGNSESECYSCADGWYLSGTTCLISCPAAGYWGDTATKTCKPCYSDSSSSLYSCVTCSGGSKSDCKSCLPGTYLYPDSTEQCLMTCPYGYWGDDMTNICRQCTPNMENAPFPCAAIDEAKDANMTNTAFLILSATANALQSANAISGMSYINLLLSLSAIESIANMQYLNINHSVIALGAYSGLSSSIIPNWITKFNHLNEENLVFNYGIFEKNHFSALYLDNNGDFLTEIFIYGGICLLTGVISPCMIKENLARTRIGKVYAITTGLLLSNVFGHIQTLTLFSLIQILKVSLVVDAYSGVGYFLAYLTLTSVVALYILCFFKLKAIFEKKAPELEPLKKEADEWNETKYEMLYEDFKESSRSSFFFSYWIAAFNIVYILLIFTLQSVPVIQCLSIIVVALSFTIISAIVNPMKKKSANFVHFFNFGCILFLGFVNLAIAIKEVVTGDHSSNKLAGWVIFYTVMANTGMNILIGLGGLLIQLFQVILNRINKKRVEKEKGSITGIKRIESSALKKGDGRELDSSSVLSQLNNFSFNSCNPINLSTTASISSNPFKPRIIKKVRKTTAQRFPLSLPPISMNGLDTRSLTPQNKGMSQNNNGSTNNWVIESRPRFKPIKFIKDSHNQRLHFSREDP